VIDKINADNYYYSAEGLEAEIGPWTLSLRTAINDAEIIVENRGPAWVDFMIIDERPTVFAFASESRRDLFRQLLAISGIGPESALLIMELGSDEEILLAAASKDQQFFRQVPGIGPARIKILFQDLGKRNSLPAPLPIPITAWRIVRQAWPQISSSDPRLQQLVGCDERQLRTIIAGWEE
jgi:hypothetical protein